MVLVFNNGIAVTGVRGPLSPVMSTAASAATEKLNEQVYLFTFRLNP